MLDNYIFTCETTTDKVKPSELGGYWFVPRDKAEAICSEHFGWQLPKSHNLIQYNGNDIIVADFH